MAISLTRVRRRPYRLKVENFGPIKSAEIEFGDLTVLVDVRQVKYEFRRAGIDWQQQFELFLDVFFGEGMRSLHQSKTKVAFRGLPQDLRGLVANTKPVKGEAMFF